MAAYARSRYARAALTTLVASLWVCCGCEETEEPPGGGPGDQRDLVYAGAAPGAELLGDLVRPPDVTEPPVVVLVHGGGFFQGERDSIEDVAQQLAAAGVASFNVDYRLVGVNGGEFPGSSVDVRDAVRYLKAHREELEIGEVCGTWGSSAGGTLAALASFSLDDPTMVRAGWSALHGYSDEAPVFVGLYGVYDFTTREEQHGYVPWPEEDYLGGTHAEHPLRYEYASPASWVDGDEGPVLLLHGEADALVDLEQSLELRDQLEGIGAEVTLHTYPDAIHGFLYPIEDDNIDSSDALERSVTFLAEQCSGDLGGGGGPGDLEVVQAGTATLDGTTLTGEETYTLREVGSEEAICTRGYLTEGESFDDSRALLTYTLGLEEGDCSGAVYAPENGQTRVYVIAPDPRDSVEAMFLDDEGRGLFRWFDVDGASEDLAYGLTQRLPPAMER